MRLDTYLERLREGREPENFDKEFLRLWFRENCDPYNDKELPEAPREMVEELSRRYRGIYEDITGERFVEHDGPIEERIERNMAAYREGG